MAALAAGAEGEVEALAEYRGARGVACEHRAAIPAIVPGDTSVRDAFGLCCCVSHSTLGILC